MPDGAEPALRDQLPGQGQGRDAAVVEADHGLHPVVLGAPGRRRHGLGLGQGVGQRLFDEDVLAGGQGGDGDFRVHEARRADVDDLDVVAGDHLAPVRGGLGPAVLRGRLGDPVRVASDQDAPFEGRDVEVAGNVAPGIRVGLAHERVADHGHPQRGAGPGVVSWEFIAGS